VRRASWPRRLAVASLLAAAFGYVPHHLFGRTGLAHVLELERNVAELRRVRDRARVENDQLAAQAAFLRDDPRALERVARDELGLVRTGEILYQVAEGVGARSSGSAGP
jgi:cell division protein FtsB